MYCVRREEMEDATVIIFASVVQEEEVFYVRYIDYRSIPWA